MGCSGFSSGSDSSLATAVALASAARSMRCFARCLCRDAAPLPGRRPQVKVKMKYMTPATTRHARKHSNQWRPLDATSHEACCSTATASEGEGAAGFAAGVEDTAAAGLGAGVTTAVDAAGASVDDATPSSPGGQTFGPETRPGVASRVALSPRSQQAPGDNAGTMLGALAVSLKVKCLQKASASHSAWHAMGSAKKAPLGIASVTPGCR
mmetsp:Transcript_11733/g.33789  ORF Transcript_11733/g.33789 Transcript_11733/m.33789 type:complete len:210 (-) Transcript_11733:108-737(-)